MQVRVFHCRLDVLTRPPALGKLELYLLLKFFLRGHFAGLHHNPHRLPGEAPQVTVQPIRPVPFNAPKAALTLDVLMTPSGKEIGVDDVLDMLEAQPAAGLSWRTWHARNWTRSDWEAALEILESQGLVTPRQSGRTTTLTVSPDDAMDAIERLA